MPKETPLIAENLYYISDVSLEWLFAVGIDTEEKLLATPAEEIYSEIKKARSNGSLQIRTLSRCMLYALRSAQHHLETGEKLPYHIFMKPSDKKL
jgi:hypothetical protein